MYTLEGKLIGDSSDFIEHVRANFCKATVSLTKESHDSRLKDNIRKIEEEMRRRKEGDTLGEKINKQLEKVKKKKVVSQINKDFFE